MADIKNLCVKWGKKSQHVNNNYSPYWENYLISITVFRPSRRFVNQMLGLLRNLHNDHIIHLTETFQRDVAWFVNVVSL